MNKFDYKQSQVDRRAGKLLRKFKWHRWFCRFFGYLQSYHLQIMKDIAGELEAFCAQEAESE